MAKEVENCWPNLKLSLVVVIVIGVVVVMKLQTFYTKTEREKERLCNETVVCVAVLFLFPATLYRAHHTINAHSNYTSVWPMQ